MTPGFGSGSPRKKSKTINDVLFQKELKIAQAHIESSNFASAEEHLKRLLQKVPRHEGALFELTQLWNRQQSYQQTIALLASSDSPEKISPALTFNLASAFESEGFLSDAIFAYQNILAIEPDNHSALCNLSNSYRKNNEFDKCILFYNNFKNVITQIPQAQQIIPTDNNSYKSNKEDNLYYEFEPDEDEILQDLLPKNISTQIFKAFLENAASEQGSRMTAMDNATRNAGDLVDKLTINYNRSRQASITKELIEIISGAESL